jgi:pre-mRNA-splicing helicase BRR2
VDKDDQVKVQVSLEREGDPAPVYAPYFPSLKEEGWWAVVGEYKTSRLLAIKKFSIGTQTNLVLSFPAPDPGAHDLTMYVMSDCYVGANQGEDFVLSVKE